MPPSAPQSPPPPPPPPHVIPVSSTNGFLPTSNSIPGHNGQSRRFAHIQDLVRQAEDQVHENDTLERLLNRASNALQTAHTHINYGRPDYALVEFSIAYMILSKVLPRHKDFPRLQDQARLRQLHTDCLKRSKLDQDTYDEVIRTVRDNNLINDTKPRSNLTSTVGDVTPRANGNLQSLPSSRQESRPQSIQFPAIPTDLPSSRPSHNSRPSSVASSRSADRFHESRPRPPVHAKPSTLQGHAIDVHASASSKIGPEDNLISRFATLRAGSSTVERTVYQNGHNATQNGHSIEPRSLSTSSRSDVSKELPKLPSPTYSPIKTDHHGPEFPLPQVLRPRIMPSSDAGSVTSSSTLSYAPSQSDREHRVDTYELSSAANRTEETEIDAQKLFDYLSQYKVLLIDVRPREDFDKGHIWYQSIICIEPAALRPRRSAEELQDTLVIGTDSEAALFAERHEFELVVYFDQSTRSTDFLRSPDAEQSPLRCLRDSLHLYNEEKPLKRQPIFLQGGMDAFVDLMGSHSLITSNTVASRAAGLKPARPIARRPLITGTSRLNVTKRPHRDYNPLAPEEERKWRDRALSESVVMQFPSQETQQVEESDAVGHFELRYPDVPALEYQVLAANPPSRPPPQAPTLPPYAELPPAAPTRPPPIVARPSYRGVSERTATPSQQLAKAPHLAQHIPSELRRLPRTGLVNFGVTCYMNATIQCLSATLPLSAYFLTPGQRYQQDIQEDNWKGSKGILSGLYCKLLEHLWQPKGFDTVRPRHFRQFCARLNREWGYDRQQDAKEFLEFLIDTFHEDFNMNWARNPLRALTPEEEAYREKLPPFLASKREFARYQHRDSSKITDLFAGQHISRLQCTTCKHSSTTYETFYSISVEIPPAAKGRQVSIYDCMRSYCSAEMLSGDELWRCPTCNKDREATKRITISRAPEFLVVHFKRFSASHAEKARKVHTAVDFPLMGFDLEPYMLPPPEAAVVKYYVEKFGPESFEAEMPRCMQPPYKYDAYAVMRHLGTTMTSGHYTALCKDQSTGMWRDYNDDTVRDFRPESLSSSKRLQNEQAYIVFYQRTA